MHAVAAVFYIVDVFISVSGSKRLRKKDVTLVYVRYLMGTAYLPERFMRIGYDFFCKILPVPRALLLVDIDPAKAVQRLETRPDAKEMFEDPANLAKYRRKVLALAENGWAVLDNSGGQDDSRRALDAILTSWENERLIDF
jgi:dTMP kinase